MRILVLSTPHNGKLLLYSYELYECIVEAVTADDNILEGISTEDIEEDFSNIEENHVF